ncbi:DUF262 domain-containing protein [Taibaiella helva]|uniref:DUF262 domain-containing protein n=1 Tax=Taibaiella helva TaxID=2301235 RepID=UPI000E58071D|nr:DUF262 domain-containing protein [Taibaiella helva]
MNLEFDVKNGNSIILVVQKQANDENKYNLIDSDKAVWMELRFTGKNLDIISQSTDIIDDAETIDSKLDLLLHSIIEAERSGTDEYSEAGDSTELNPYDPDKIKVRSDKISVTLISNMIESGDIDMNPDFQRNLVWNNFQKSRLIESILLRIPLPMFYFAEDDEGKLSVVDGLQRLTAIKEFMDNKFSLRDLQYLTDSCYGKYYEHEGIKKGLDPKYFRWFNLTTISANIIDPTSPYKVKYDIFRRINTGGRPLNNQEIRNCLTGQGLRDILKEMTALPEFKSATDNSIKSTRMDDQEIALRFLVFFIMYEKNRNINSYNGYMDATLDEFTELNIKTKKEDLEHYVVLFSNAMKNAEYLFGKRHAFRKILPKDISPNAHKQLINKSLFVCTSVLLAEFGHETIVDFNERDSLRSEIAMMIEEDDELFAYLSYGTNAKANLLYTFKSLKELFNKNIDY